jgi:hypothetical protein
MKCRIYVNPNPTSDRDLDLEDNTRSFSATPDEQRSKIMVMDTDLDMSGFPYTNEYGGWVSIVSIDVSPSDSDIEEAEDWITYWLSTFK